MLVTQRTDRVSRIWVLSETSGRRENAAGLTPNGRRRSNQFGDIDSEQFGLDWTPDGRLVYASTTSGNLDVGSRPLTASSRNN